MITGEIFEDGLLYKMSPEDLENAIKHTRKNPSPTRYQQLIQNLELSKENVVDVEELKSIDNQISTLKKESEEYVLKSDLMDYLDELKFIRASS